MADGNVLTKGTISDTGNTIVGGSFIQPYTDSQTTAKDIILQKKGGNSFAGDLSQIDAYKRNQLLTLYAQELFGAASTISVATQKSIISTPLQK